MAAEVVGPPATQRTVEERVETLLRRAYPLLKGRTPATVRVGCVRSAIHHGGRKDHLYAIYQCFYRNQYEVPAPLFTPDHHRRALQARYDSTVLAGRRPLIVDCGANIGASAVWFQARYPRAKIVALEPEPHNLDLLRRNAAGSDIEVMGAAIGARAGHMFLDGATTSALAHRVVADGTGPSVEVITLGDAMARAPGCDPFILKVDIEGGEKELFDAAPDLLAQFPLIIVEPHDFCMPADRVSQALFRFHAREGRDFLFGNENVFSFDAAAITPSPARAARSAG